MVCHKSLPQYISVANRMWQTAANCGKVVPSTFFGAGFCQNIYYHTYILILGDANMPKGKSRGKWVSIYLEKEEYDLLEKVKEEFFSDENISNYKLLKMWILEKLQEYANKIENTSQYEKYQRG